ncbi:MAG: 2-oxoacid:acceptor oxidoreductase subunit alpha, partial [Dehalococcoidia bacterium]
YPITPASEIMNRICNRFAELRDKGEHRVFVQMEDELGSIASCIGASWAGAKAMTATSGPGLSLMLENIGYAIITETPLVIVDVQRAGPSTGQATRPAQGDVMQARWGAHGDYEIIALSPWSVAEMYSQTIRAFNLAERFRVPVFVLADEALGHLREGLEIEGELRVYNRLKAKGEPPFGEAKAGPLSLPEVPPMPAFGDGEKLLVTGSTHDEWGYRRTSSAEAQERLVSRLTNKITNHLDEIVETEGHLCDQGELEVLVVAYGFTARSALRAVRMARENGISVGLLRLKTIWPFPANAIKELGQRSKRMLVPEMNRGQIAHEVERVVSRVESYTKTNGEVITPKEILAKIR